MTNNRLQRWMLQTIQKSVDTGDYKRAIDISIRYLEFTGGGENDVERIQIYNLKAYAILNLRLRANERN